MNVVKLSEAHPGACQLHTIDLSSDLWNLMYSLNVNVKFKPSQCLSEHPKFRMQLANRCHIFGIYKEVFLGVNSGH